MYGELTDKKTIEAIDQALELHQTEQFEILLYKKNSKFTDMTKEAVVAQQHSTRLQSKTLEDLGLNPARCWAFFFSSLSNQLCVLNSGPSQRCNTSDFPIKIGLAMQLETKQA